MAVGLFSIHTFGLKGMTHENGGGLGRRRMLGISLGPW
jgi:hypothetical protein